MHITVILTSFKVGSSMEPHDNHSVTSELEGKSCPPWTFYDTSSNGCMCYEFQSINNERIIECTDKGTSLADKFCMTYDEENGIISASNCPYYEVEGHNVSEPGRISLPDNISELNEYMCGPMNRKGPVCSECIDGYGPSVTSLRYKCVKCKSVCYGVSLYLIIEVVPVTIFYIVVLLFQLNLTSAAMISFVMYSNAVVHAMNVGHTMLIEVPQYKQFVSLLYGVWSLDFIRYAMPPVCIAPTLKVTHIIFLQSLSTILPYIYIAITWIVIKLHSRNYKVVVWMWKFSNRMILKHLKLKWNSEKTVVDAFASFFFLSFVKAAALLVSVLSPLYSPLLIQHINVYNHSSTITRHLGMDARLGLTSSEYLSIAVLCIVSFLFFIIPPTVFIALYPMKCFRTLLSKCLPNRHICILNIFVEKYYSCYKDGLDGSRDMRGFASTHFLLTTIILVMLSLIPQSIIIIIYIILFVGCSNFILIIQPYKKQYMAIVNSLITANLAILLASCCISMSNILSQIIVAISIILPGLGLLAYICFQLFKNPCSKLLQKVGKKIPSFKSRLHCCVRTNLEETQIENRQQQIENDDEDIPDRVLHPDAYALPAENTAT